MTQTPSPPYCRRILIGGRVQGVGFRPFVWRSANALGLTGHVCNLGGEVEVVVCGRPADIDALAHTLIHAAPPLARPQLLDDAPYALPTRPADAPPFHILHSRAEASRRIHIPPDQFACDDCLAEIYDPHERRHRYPFTNCTQCGPRYTLIARMPYDRPHTAMAGFPLCPDCTREYTDPSDRRFHAQPLACPVCGPRLQFVGAAGAADPLRATLDALHAGAIVAVKGIGGYHLMCAAHDTAALARLRERKPRPSKPLALLYPWRGDDGLGRLRQDLAPSPTEAALLSDPMRPIVLCAKRPDHRLPELIAPGLDEVGALLPYSPLHHLLADAFDAPLVATSGNLGGEPVLTENHEAQGRLAHIADAWLHHDRPILRPADDPVYRTLGGRPRPLRLGRGNAPLELRLALRMTEPTLAVGGEMKGAIALAWDDRALLGPHIGELHTPKGLALFERLCRELPALYGIVPTRLVCDRHPGYHASRWAQAQGLPLVQVQHHAAHASALYGEHAGQGEWLVFTWDGVGLGEEGGLWGGEALLGAPGHWRRVATLRPLRLPGGDKAGREPWRSAAALCWAEGLGLPDAPPEGALASQAWQRGLNCTESHAIGRLFDGVTTLITGQQRVGYEGEAGLRLEALARRSAVRHAPGPLPWGLGADGLWMLDWAPLVHRLVASSDAPEVQAWHFHATLAESLVALVEQLASDGTIAAVGLTGGVFQNRLLTELCLERLARVACARPTYLANQVPCNDAGLAFGQLVEAQARTARS